MVVQVMLQPTQYDLNRSLMFLKSHASYNVAEPWFLCCVCGPTTAVFMGIVVVLLMVETL
jgi:hypothetical protein